MEGMDDFVWVPADVHTPPPRNDDFSVNKQRLLIMRAASTDDCDMLESMLYSLQPIETPLIHSAMCRAASRGYLRAFKTLSRYCKDIHADDSRRATNTVISSVVGGHNGVLDFILANGGDIDRPTQSGRTSLISAVSLGRWDLLTLVLSRGADVSKVTADGRSCLCIAATGGRVDLVEALIKHGASVNCGCHCFTPGRFDRFHCALDVAALNGHDDVANLLLSYGASFFRESDLFLTVLEAVLMRAEEHLANRLLAAGPSLDYRLDARKITPLCLAVQRGSLVVVKFLAAYGANIHVPGQDGPPLCYAVVNNNSTIADWLIRAGADVNAYSETYGRCIHAAVEFGFVGLVDMLLRNGAEVYADSPKGYPLQIARYEWRHSCTSERQRRFEAIIDLLRNAGACDEESRAASAGIYDTETSSAGDRCDQSKWTVTDVRNDSCRDWG